MNEASARERKKYSAWLNKSYKHERYSDKLTEYHRSNGEFTPLSNEHLSKKFSKLIVEAQNTSSRESDRKRSGGSKWKITLATTSAVAATIVLLFVLFPQINSDNQNLNISSVDERTFQVPTLVLGSGSNIVLEGNNDLDKEGLVEKISDKKISYVRQKAKVGDTINVNQFNTLVIPSRYTYSIILDDSTEVHLNANSQLRYPIHFSGDVREVFLSGEAYFKVSKSSRPFIVSTTEISVKVYGTEFNVNTSNKENVEAVLISGSVGVTIQSNKTKEIEMAPNQRFKLNVISKESSVGIVDPTNSIAWRGGLFKCDNEKLSILLDKIGQWYGVTFEYSNNDIKDIPVSIKLSNSTELSNIIRAIEELSGTIIIKTSVNTYVIE